MLTKPDDAYRSPMRDTARMRQAQPGDELSEAGLGVPIARFLPAGDDFPEPHMGESPTLDFEPAGEPTIPGALAQSPLHRKRLGWVLPALAVGVVALCSGAAIVLAEVSR